jgi:DNA processing protein
MVCTPCLRRSAVVAAAAPALARLASRPKWLWQVLGFPSERLLRAARVDDPSGVLRGLRLPALTDRVPTAICRHDAGYPRALRQLPNAPAVLYGTCASEERLRELLSSPATPRVAIVGSRGLTPYTEQVTFALTRDLARAGVTLASGVNEGPEGIAHQGALEGGGATIAVMACSPDLSHLTRFDPLHQHILAQGTAISEFPPGFFEHQRWSFMASRRILAALADLIVIVEAGGYSLAVLTTHFATHLGRDIAVVPSRITDPGGDTMLWLIQDGAHPVANAEDVLHVLDAAGARAPVFPGPAISDATPHDPTPHVLVDGARVPGPAISQPALHDPTISGPALHGVAA